MNKFYVYAHRKKTDNSIFYIGKGCGIRSRRRGKARSKWWNNIVSKYGYEIEILSKNMLEHDALELEEFLISELKSQLCNITDGGEGISGYRHTEEAKRKISEAAIKSMCWKNLHSKEARARALKNQVRHNPSDITKKRMSITHSKIVGTGVGPSKRVEIEKEGFIKSFDSMSECSKYLGCSFQYVSKLVKTGKTYNGYKVKKKN